MCGIAGAAWTVSGEPLEMPALLAMTDTLRARGPDDQGFHIDKCPSGGAALGHRRLSVIDLTSGRQPLSNEDGTVWVTFNGEIYNFVQLRNDLKSRGHRFRTNSDTEVLVHLYEDYAEKCVERLRGMFAFAIWDSRQQKLLLARDRMGQKPLVYRVESNRLMFASQCRAILSVAGSPEIEARAIDAFLRFQCVPQPMTIYQGIFKLPPAHYAVYQRGKFTLTRYWEPAYGREINLDPDEYQFQLRRLLANATRMQMVSDVPLGLFLSGGIDSTIVAGLMQEASSKPIKTFSVSFPEAQMDESQYARQVAAHLGTDHHECRVDLSAISEVPGILAEFDEPFADASAIPTYYVSRLSRQQVTVALTGDGGDELFAGYSLYRILAYCEQFDRLPWAIRSLAGARLWQRLPSSPRQSSSWRRIKKLLTLLSETETQRHLALKPGAFDSVRRKELYSLDYLHSGSGAADSVLDIYRRLPNRDATSRATFVDQQTYLPDDVLVKVDVASMASGLECRSPFLDHEVVELAVGMPLRLKLRGGTHKWILRRAFADFLEPVRRRAKAGFGIPLGAWFRGGWRTMLQDVLLDDSTLGRGYFRPDTVRRLISEHHTGRFDHGERLWTLLCLEWWHRRYIDEHGRQDSSHNRHAHSPPLQAAEGRLVSLPLHHTR